MKLSALGSVTAMLLLGCAAGQPQNHEQVAATVQRSDSAFDRVSTFTGPEVLDFVNRGLLNDQVRWRVRAVTMKEGGGFAARQLYASVWHQDRSWRFYRTASFVGGAMVDARRISSDPSCMSRGGLTTCSFTEVVTVPISAIQWEGARDSGLEIRLNGQQGPHVVIRIPPAYMVGFDVALKNK